MDNKKLENELDDTLKQPAHFLARCGSTNGEAYMCVNCEKFDWDRDGCFTEWMEKYGFKQQSDGCPGYQPPKNGEYIIALFNI
ncbi:MAG: hypothetical protein Q7S27_05655 [Nanoarchaeota archaeon]|nr:hypothetical protein [Nanoarchaeota archaeon]